MHSVAVSIALSKYGYVILGEVYSGGRVLIYITKSSARFARIRVLGDCDNGYMHSGYNAALRNQNRPCDLQLPNQIFELCANVGGESSTFAALKNLRPAPTLVVNRRPLQPSRIFGPHHRWPWILDFCSLQESSTCNHRCP